MNDKTVIPLLEIPGTIVWRIYNADTGELISTEEGDVFDTRREHVGPKLRITRTVEVMWDEDERPTSVADELEAVHAALDRRQIPRSRPESVELTLAQRLAYRP